MNRELVETIVFPHNDILEGKGIKEDFKREVKELPTEAADETIVEFVIDNLGEAVDAAHDDFCCNDGIYFKIDDGEEPFEMTFDIASLRHLFGLPPRDSKKGELWKTTEIVQQLLQKYPNLVQRIENKSWLDQISEIIHQNYKQDIINHECSEMNIGIEKLNWEKMAVKIFAFINLGLLEEGQVSFYEEERNRYSTGRKKYLLVRSLRNGELEDIEKSQEMYYNKQIIIELVEEIYERNNCLTPISIMIVNKPLKRDKRREKKAKIKLSELKYENKFRNNNESVYRYKGNVIITRMRGNKYVSKGNR